MTRVMSWVNRGCRLPLFLLYRLAIASGFALRGVAPEDVRKYIDSSASGIFSCFTAPDMKLDYGIVNDNFCDCEDGSDEPSTAACAGRSTTLFYCPNLGSSPRMIYPGRVDDGVCDCCDGTDEVPVGRNGGAPVCENTCALEAEEHSVLVERLRRGVEKQKEARRDAKNSRAQWRREIEKLEADSAELEKKREEAIAAEHAQVAATTSAPSSVGIENRFAELSARIAGMQLEILELRTRLDIVERLRGTDSIVSGAKGAVQVEANVEEGRAKEPAVSEYAKWMDGAEEVAKQRSSMTTTTTTTTTTVEASSSQARGVAVTELETQIKTNQDRIEELQDKIGFWSDDKLGYFSLVDKCIENDVDGYVYQICFFKDAHQGSTLLGSWSKWNGQRRALFKSGASCWGGLTRELTVKFQCAEVENIVSVVEPSRCVYEAIVHAPGACGKKSLEEIEKDTPNPRYPRDEL